MGNVQGRNILTLFSGYFSTSGTGNPFAMVNYQYFPNIWTVGDTSYLCWQQRDGGIYNNASEILSFNHNTKAITSYDWGAINPPDEDVHLMPAIIGTADNKILMLREDPHDGEMFPRISGANFDISTFTAFTAFGDNLDYPHIIKFTNGDMYCLTRTYYNAEAGGNDCWKSTDNGQTWVRVSEFVLYLDAANDELMYPLTPFSGDNKLRLFINKRVGQDPVTFPTLLYMESSDGITWANVDGSYSKNTVSGGSINLSDLDLHYLVLKYGTGSLGDGVIRASGACVGNDGYPVAIGGYNDSANSLRFIKWNGTSWESKAISVSGHAIYGSYTGGSQNPNPTDPFNNAVAIVPVGGTTYDLYAMENVNGYSQMSLFRTTNNGDTWAFVKQLTTALCQHWDIHISANYSETRKGIVACVAQVNASFSDIFISELPGY